MMPVDVGAAPRVVGGPAIAFLALEDLIGELVSLHSLNATELNGSQGIATGVDYQAHRLIVKLHSGRTVKVRGPNISCSKWDAILEPGAASKIKQQGRPLKGHTCNAGCGVVAEKSKLLMCSRCKHAVSVCGAARERRWTLLDEDRTLPNAQVYCSKQCQRRHWKATHKDECAALSARPKIAEDAMKSAMRLVARHAHVELEAVGSFARFAVDSHARLGRGALVLEFLGMC